MILTTKLKNALKKIKLPKLSRKPREKKVVQAAPPKPVPRGFKIIERYPLYEPFAHVAIVQNPKTGEFKYILDELQLDPLEQNIYIGASTKEEVVHDYSIHVGAPFVFAGSFGLLNPEINDDVIAGYSMDNLAALTCLIVLTEKLVKNLINDFGINDFNKLEKLKRVLKWLLRTLFRIQGKKYAIISSKLLEC